MHNDRPKQQKFNLTIKTRGKRNTLPHYNSDVTAPLISSHNVNKNIKTFCIFAVDTEIIAIFATQIIEALHYP